MESRPSLGVLIPTRNCTAQMASHLVTVGSWQHLAAEIVVVDSFSEDGTLDLVRSGLRHPRLQVLSHPPGLYASWNHGIAALRSEYTYIATVGDQITAEGVEHLLAVAEELRADVVVSKPNFVDPEGRALPDIPWPLDDILATLSVKAPRRLHKLETLVFAAAHVNSALTGSCASCLFRTSVLRRFPFPIEMGTVGDNAWCVLHAPEVVWAVVPGRFSTFLKHSPNVSDVDKRTSGHSPRLEALLAEAAARWLATGVVTAPELDAIRWPALLEAVTVWAEAKATFDRRRRAAWPWVLNPLAWAGRVRRQHWHARVVDLKEEGLRRATASRELAS